MTEPVDVRAHLDAGAASDNAVLFLSHTHDGGVFKVGSHHLARSFARMGYDVVHLSTPHSRVHDWTSTGPPSRKEAAARGAFVDDAGVLQIVPSTWLPVQAPVDRFLKPLTSPTRRPRFRFVFVDQPLMAVHRYKRLGRTLIYRPTDMYLQGISRRRQERLLPFAHGVAATSEEVLSRLALPSTTPGVAIENGAEIARFTGHGNEERSGAIYVGALDARFDWDVVSAIAVAHPTLQVTLAGPSSSVPIDLPSNVRLLGPVPYSAVPELLNASRVGLLPFSDDPMNEGRSPMKLFEYLAAGLHIVGRRTPVLARLEAPGVQLYSTAAEAVLQVERGLEQSVNSLGSDFARAFDWSVKAEALEAFAREVEIGRP